MNEKEPKVVLDTCILLTCICQGRHDKNNNSRLDINTRLNHGDPEHIRGYVINLLRTNAVVIPETVYKELQNHLYKSSSQKTLSETNRQNLKNLLDTLQGYTTKTIPTREEVFALKTGLEDLQNHAQLTMDKHINRNKQYEEFKEEWEYINIHEQTHKSDLRFYNFKKDIKMLPTCMTWLKVKDHLPDAQKNVENLLTNTHVTQTEQIHLLEEAQDIRKELKMEEHEETPPKHELSPVVYKILEQLQQNIAKGERHQYEKLRPENLSKAPRHIQASTLEFLAEELAPQLLPDYEIALVAVKEDAKIITLDNDFFVLQHFITPLKDLPKPEKKPVGPQESLHNLLTELRKNLRNKKNHTNPKIDEHNPI